MPPRPEPTRAALSDLAFIDEVATIGIIARML